tara:strand:- start:280 stop:1077 length:798 start_codon:yes stop_codon:yes gene_type:complete
MKYNLISILITNYNKSKFLEKSLKSVQLQNYKNYEVIIFDDASTDNSLKIIKKFKKMKLIINKKKLYNSSALNQINGLKKAFFKSKGKIICLMDADDCFKKNKLFEINRYFALNKGKKVLYNLPIVAKGNNFKISKIANNRVWPTIFPTSCISVKRDFLRLFFQNIELKNYENLEIDARVNIFFNFYLNEYNILKKRLTNYNYDYFGITSKIPKYSKKWWLRRSEAFDYLKTISLKKKILFKLNIDYLFTKFMSFILNFKGINIK